MRLLRISHGFPKETVIRGEHAELLKHSFLEREAVKEWETDHPFLGNMTKKTYILPNPQYDPLDDILSP